MMFFSQRLKWLREKKGLTQKEMAEKLGISQQYYGRFEKGTGQPNLETLYKLRHILGESLDFLLGVYIEDHFAQELYELYIEARHSREEAENRISLAEEVLNDMSSLDTKLKVITNLKSELSKLVAKEENAFNKFFDYLIQIPGVDEEYAQKEFWVNRYNDVIGEQDSNDTRLIRKYED